MTETTALCSQSERASVDPVRVLSEAVQQPGSALRRLPGTPAKRPFDAQYWACWVATALLPVVVAYFWMTA